MPAGPPLRSGPGTGIAGAPVSPVCRGPVGALVSTIVEDRVRPSRANVTAHQAVVDAAHRDGPVLPVRFGTVMPDEEAVENELLCPNLDRFRAELQRLEGKAEYRLTATYLEETVLSEIVERSPAVRRARAATRRPGGASRDRMIRLGELVRYELGRLRETDGRAILEQLRPHVMGCRELAERSDRVALRAAVLVERAGGEALAGVAERIAAGQAERMRIELTGPLAPWDFADGTGEVL